MTTPRVVESTIQAVLNNIIKPQQANFDPKRIDWELVEQSVRDEVQRRALHYSPEESEGAFRRVMDQLSRQFGRATVQDRPIGAAPVLGETRQPGHRGVEGAPEIPIPRPSPGIQFVTREGYRDRSGELDLKAWGMLNDRTRQRIADTEPERVPRELWPHYYPTFDATGVDLPRAMRGGGDWEKESGIYNWLARLLWRGR